MRLELKDNLHTESQVKLLLYIRLKSGNLKLIDYRESPNLITDVGHTHIADQMGIRSQVPMRNMAVGTVSGGKNAASLALENEIARVAIAEYNNVLNALLYRCVFAEGVGVGALKEAGIFNNSLAGDMLAWSDYGAVNKNVNHVLEIQWTINY